MSANNDQFVRTRNMFREHLSGSPKNPTYEEWLEVDYDDKACSLFVKFYQEITLAWYSAVISSGIVYISQEDGVSTVLQYLMKNVDYIINDKNRYSTEYIYQVCYNCLLSLWRTRSTEMKRSGLEISNELDPATKSAMYGDRFSDKSLNLWDLVPSEDDDIETQQTKEAIWNIIDHMGLKAEKVVNHLINPDETLHRISKSSSERPLDRLADVSVSKAEFEEIVAELRVQLEPYRSAILNF